MARGWLGHHTRSGEASLLDATIKAKGLKQINDTGTPEAIIDKVIAANPAKVEQYKTGKD